MYSVLPFCRIISYHIKYYIIYIASYYSTLYVLNCFIFYHVHSYKHITILHLCMLCIQVFVHKIFTGKTGPVYPLHSSRIQTGCSSATLKTLQQHRSAIRQGKTSAESLMPCHCEIRLMPLPSNPTVFWSAILSWVGLNR